MKPQLLGSIVLNCRRMLFINIDRCQLRLCFQSKLGTIFRCRNLVMLVKIDRFPDRLLDQDLLIFVFRERRARFVRVFRIAQDDVL